MNDLRIPAEDVAAAILLIKDCAMECRELCLLVEATGLSGLRSRGGSTPWKTLRTAMSKRGDLFQGHGSRSGLYQIANDSAALSDRDVRRALLYLMGAEVETYRQLLSDAIVKRVDISDNANAGCRRAIEEAEKKLFRLARLYIPVQPNPW